MGALWVATYLAVLLWSAYAPKDVFTWFLEALPALVALPLLAATRRRFPLTPLAYVLIWLHASILLVGAHYTYAEVPLFDTLREVFHWQRNNYDKVGHFAQGFVPAILAREILLRLGVVRSQGWLAFVVICFCLALSATYELVEWGVAVASGEAGVAFLATQGDPWDTQSDMAWALIGAASALLLLSRLHDRQLAGLTRR